MADGKSKIELIVEAVDRATKVVERIEKSTREGIKTQKDATRGEAQAAMAAERLATVTARRATAEERKTQAVTRSKIAEQQLATATARAAAATDRAAMAALAKARAGRRAADEAQRQERANNQLAAGFTRLAREVGATAAAYLTFSSAFSFTKDALEAVKIMDRIENGLEQIAGSATLGAEEFEYVRNEAERMGLVVKDVAAEYAKLIAAGDSVGFTMEEMREIFEATNDAAVALSLSNEDVHGTLRAIQQMMSKGTVQAEELRGQLGERLYGAFGRAAAAMGVTTQELGKMLETGDVLAKDLLPLLAKEMKKVFGEQAEKASRDYAREVARLENAMFDLRLEMGRKFETQLTPAIRELKALIEEMVENGTVDTLASGLLGLVKVMSSVKDLLPIGIDVAFTNDLAASQLGGGATQEEILARGRAIRELQGLSRAEGKALSGKARAELASEGRVATVAAVEQRRLEILERQYAVAAGRARQTKEELEAEQAALRATRDSERLAKSMAEVEAKHAEKMTGLRRGFLEDTERLAELEAARQAAIATQDDDNLLTADRAKARERELALEQEIYAIRKKQELELHEQIRANVEEKRRLGDRAAEQETKHEEAMEALRLGALVYEERRAALLEAQAAVSADMAGTEDDEERVRLRARYLELERQIAALDDGQRTKEAQAALEIAERIVNLETDHAQAMEAIRLGALRQGERLIELERLRAAAAATRAGAEPGSAEYLAARERELAIERQLAALRNEDPKVRDIDPNSLRENLESVFLATTTYAQMAANAASTFFGTMQQDIAANLDDLLLKVTDLEGFLSGLWSGFLGSMRQAFTQMVAEWAVNQAKMLAQYVLTKTGMLAVDKAVSAKSLVLSLAAAAKSLVAWIPAAIAALVASFGVAGAIGLAAGVALFGAAASGGFKDGVVDVQGPGGPRSDSIQTRISSGESVITSRATQLNKPYLQYANDGGNIGDLVKRESATPQIWVVGTDEMAEQLASTIPGEATIRRLADEQIQRRRG